MIFNSTRFTIDTRPRDNVEQSPISRIVVKSSPSRQPQGHIRALLAHGSYPLRGRSVGGTSILGDLPWTCMVHLIWARSDCKTASLIRSWQMPRRCKSRTVAMPVRPTGASRPMLSILQVTTAMFRKFEVIGLAADGFDDTFVRILCDLLIIRLAAISNISMDFECGHFSARVSLRSAHLWYDS